MQLNDRAYLKRSMSEPSPDPRFRAAFARWSRRVRRRLALRIVLTGAAAGLALGAVGAAAAWKLGRGELRPWAAAGGLLGAAAGAAVARRRRWPDASVALYLDGRLGSDEAIATAVELDRAEGSEPARAVVIAQAARALDGATAEQVRAPLWRPWHAAVPLAAAAIGYLTWIPLPPAPAAPPSPPGVEQVKVADLAGLEKILKLADVSARDDAQRDRLKALAEDAKKLREKLRSGVEKREAQADIARLRDALTAERLSLGEGQERQGMESALGKLGEDPDLRSAAKALGDRDLVAFDEEMERLANKLEKQDREQAKRTLKEAQEAAKKAGAPNVARALEEQQRRLEEQGRRTEKLKELARALGEGLGEEGRQALGALGQSGRGEDAQKLAESLEKALGGLSEQERKQLAENLKKQAAQAPEGAPGEGPSKQEMKELAEQLGSPEGQQQLGEQLKEMAQAPAAGSEEGERQKALDGAQEGAGEAEGQLGPRPMPVPVAGGKGAQGQSGQNGGPGKGGDKGGKNGSGAMPGHSEGGGPGEHGGQTGAVAGGGEMKSRASAKINPGTPMPGMVMGRAAGRPGESANVQGEGALGGVASDEVGAVERSEVPEEYREQVGRYFQPK